MRVGSGAFYGVIGKQHRLDMKSLLPLFLILAVVTSVNLCCQTEPDNDTAEERSKVYNGAGRLTSLLPGGRHVKILHGPIADFMEAMEMSFPLEDSLQLDNVSVGDSIHFKVRALSDGYFYLEELRLVGE